MIKPLITMLCSAISHMPLHYVWRDSGVAEKHGFKLVLDVCEFAIEGQPWITHRQRADLLLQGTYDFLSGLHHETYLRRARGDKRLVYLAQAQNDWDDRIVASKTVASPTDLEGKKFIVTSSHHCVFGNLKNSLKLAGAHVDRIEFVAWDVKVPDVDRRAVEAVARGEAAAASVDIPFDRLGEKLGLHGLEVPSLPVIHNATICANREWVKQNEETALAFLRSMVEAIYYFKTQKERVCEILERRLAPLVGLREADEIEHLQASWAALLSAKPYPHPLAVWNVYNLEVAHDPGANFIGPLEMWDTSYLRTIDDEGFVESLYGGQPAAATSAAGALA